MNSFVKILSNKKIDISSIGYNYFIDSIILKNKNEEETKSEKGKLLFWDPPYENVKSSNKVNYGTAQKKGKIKKDDKESCSIERVVKKVDEFINSNNTNIAVLTYSDSEILEKELGMCNLKFFKQNLSSIFLSKNGKKKEENEWIYIIFHSSKTIERDEVRNIFKDSLEKTKKCSSADFENYTQEVLFDVSLNNKDAEDFGLGKLILHKFENLSKLTIVVSKKYIRIKKKDSKKCLSFVIVLMVLIRIVLLYILKEVLKLLSLIFLIRKITIRLWIN